MKTRWMVIAAWALGLAATGTAQTDPAKLTLDRIFVSPDFRSDGDHGGQWLDAGTLARKAPSATTKNFSDIVTEDAATGNKTVLVAAEKLVPPGAKEPLKISGFTLSKDRDAVLISTNTTRVWRRDTRGDYWVFTIPTGKLHKLGGDAKPSSLQFAKFSPDGKTVGYVRENNIWVEQVDAQAKPARLTSDGNTSPEGEIINGTFDWVYEEEFDCRDGWDWAPDGKSVAYWQIDTRGVPRFTMINQTEGRYPKLTSFAYPKTGERNSLCRVGVVPAAGGATTWMKVPGDTRVDGYIPKMEFTPDGKGIVLQRMNRLQNRNDVMLADPGTGNAKTLFTETDAAWVDTHDDAMRWMADGRRFVWVSERDGWRHAHMASLDGGVLALLTPGNYDVKEVLNVDEEGGFLWFTASPGKPTEQHLYRAPLKPDGKPPERVTPPGTDGWNDYKINPKGTLAFWTHSAFGLPPAQNLVDLKSHKTIRTTQDNAKARSAVSALARSPVEWFKVPLGAGLEMDGWMIKPPGFDPARKYPVLFHAYGEPAGQTVADRWGGNNYLWHLYLAQQGYIVASMDNRGTKTPKGRDWRRSVYRKIGQVTVADQAAGAREVAKRSYVDPARIAVWGWSGGGSMTLNLMFQHPELYSTGMSVAPVPDMSLYDTIYQERYMGLPADNAADYKAGSPITHAAKLRGNLLIVHGTGDDNVHYQGTEKLVNALVAEGKDFTLMAYPNRSHSVSEGKGTTRHLYGLMTRYLQEKTPPGPR